MQPLITSAHKEQSLGAAVLCGPPVRVGFMPGCPPPDFVITEAHREVPGLAHHTSCCLLSFSSTVS